MFGDVIFLTHSMVGSGIKDDPRNRRRCLSETMQCVVALAVLIAFCASASAATVRHARPHGHSRSTQRITVYPDQRLAGPRRFAVPGWSDEQTRQWLDNATAAAGLY